jgi:phage portal protein, SPP1 gp6-like
MPVTAEQLQKMLRDTKDQHEARKRQYEDGAAYYLNRGDILKGGAAAIQEVNAYLKKLGKNPLRSADNRISTNWHRILADQKISYLFTYPPQFDIRKDDGTVEQIRDVLGDEYEQIIKQLGIIATNAGKAWLAYWYDQSNRFCYYYIDDSSKVREVYDTSTIKPRLSALVYTYETTDENGITTTHYDVWTDRDATYFVQPLGGAFTLLETRTHEYGEIPFIPFNNNATCTGDLLMYKRIIDAIDKLISGFANDIDDIQEILWVIKNYAGQNAPEEYNEQTGAPVKKEIDLLQMIKAKKMLFVDEDGGVDTIQGEIPYEARSKFLEILIDQLYVSAMAVNTSTDKVGNQSGVYIEFLYSLLELKAGLMETEFRPALGRLVKAILRFLRKPGNAKVEQIWTRNKPRNDLELSQMIAQTAETVLSDETKTKVHPLVEDWKSERKQIRKEQQEMRLTYMTPAPPAKENE